MGTQFSTQSSNRHVHCSTNFLFILRSSICTRYVSCGFYMGTPFCTQSSNRFVHFSSNFLFILRSSICTRYVSCGLYMGIQFCTQSSNSHVHCSVHPAVLDLALVTYPAASVWRYDLTTQILDSGWAGWMGAKVGGKMHVCTQPPCSPHFPPNFAPCTNL
jgi:hypothetical protein